jgi:hypothetical protein
MAETNRTERRLLDSIRRAKTSTENEGLPERAPTASPDRSPDRSQDRATKASSATANPDQGEAKATPKATATSALARSLHTLDKNPTDRYQSGPRVWPD